MVLTNNGRGQGQGDGQVGKTAGHSQHPAQDQKTATALLGSFVNFTA